MLSYDRKSILNRLIAPGVKQEAFDRFVGVVLVGALAATALAGAVMLVVDIIRSGGV